MELTGTELLALSADAWLAQMWAAIVSPTICTIAAAGSTLHSVSEAWGRLMAWWQDSYRHAPVLMVGIAAMFVVPLLAVAGVAVRRSRQTRAIPSGDEPAIPDLGDVPTRSARADGLTWPVDAWIEIEGDSRSRMPVVREVLRIGREDDNDLVVPAETVHRYHAVVHRTEDADIVIIDTSGNDGNGVAVNGRRASRQRLKDGDVIEIGKARLRFSTRRVGVLAG